MTSSVSQKFRLNVHYPPELLKEVNSGHLRSAKFHGNGRAQKPPVMLPIDDVPGQ